MPFTTVQSLKYREFQSFQHEDLCHGVFTRHGGASRAPWKSLNVGASLGDDPAHVRENKQRIFSAMGLAVEQAYEVWQVHSDRVVNTSTPRDDQKLLKADAIITAAPGVVLFMRFADCVPVLFYDPQKRVIALAHAGWKGTAAKIAANVVSEMTSCFGCKPGNILAALGPSICVDHYQVGEEVVQAMQESFGPVADGFLTIKKDQTHLDLWQANIDILTCAGIQSVELAQICTACDNKDWYSHRHEHGHTGRFGVLISMV